MAELIGFVLIIIISYIVYCYRRDNKSDDNDELQTCVMNEATPSSSSQKENAKMKVRELCIETLKELNCEVEFDEEDEARLFFSFQGEHFFIDAPNDSVFFTIWDTHWYSVSLDDLDSVSMLRKAINVVNINFDNTMVYSMDEENNQIVVHTKRSCLLMDEIPNKNAYMRAVLESFFIIHRRLFMIMDDIQNEEKKQA